MLEGFAPSEPRSHERGRLLNSGTFAQVAGEQGTAVLFDLDGKHLWYGSYDGRRPRLSRARLKSGPLTQFKLPSLTQDAVSYIAQNPARRTEYAIATFQRVPALYER